MIMTISPAGSMSLDANAELSLKESFILQKAIANSFEGLASTNTAKEFITLLISGALGAYCGYAIGENKAQGDVVDCAGQPSSGGTIFIYREFLAIVWRSDEKSYKVVKTAEQIGNFDLILPTATYMTSASRLVGSLPTSYAVVDNYVFLKFQGISRLACYPKMNKAVLDGDNVVQAYGITTGTWGCDFFPTTIKGGRCSLLNNVRSNPDVVDYSSKDIGVCLVNRASITPFIEALRSGGSVASYKSLLRAYHAPSSLVQSLNGALYIMIKPTKASYAKWADQISTVIVNTNHSLNGAVKRLCQYAASGKEVDLQSLCDNIEGFMVSSGRLADLMGLYEDKYRELLREALAAARETVKTVYHELCGSIRKVQEEKMSINELLDRCAGVPTQDTSDMGTFESGLIPSLVSVSLELAGVFTTVQDAIDAETSLLSKGSGYVAAIEDDPKMGMTFNATGYESACKGAMKSLITNFFSSKLAKIDARVKEPFVAAPDVTVKSDWEKSFSYDHGCGNECEETNSVFCNDDCDSATIFKGKDAEFTFQSLYQLAHVAWQEGSDGTFTFSNAGSTGLKTCKPNASDGVASFNGVDSIKFGSFYKNAAGQLCCESMIIRAHLAYFQCREISLSQAVTNQMNRNILQMAIGGIELPGAGEATSKPEVYSAGCAGYPVNPAKAVWAGGLGTVGWHRTAKDGCNKGQMHFSGYGRASTMDADHVAAEMTSVTIIYRDFCIGALPNLKPGPAVLVDEISKISHNGALLMAGVNAAAVAWLISQLAELGVLDDCTWYGKTLGGTFVDLDTLSCTTNFTSESFAAVIESLTALCAAKDHGTTQVNALDDTQVSQIKNLIKILQAIKPQQSVWMSVPSRAGVMDTSIDSMPLLGWYCKL